MQKGKEEIQTRSTLKAAHLGGAQVKIQRSPVFKTLESISQLVGMCVCLFG